MIFVCPAIKTLSHRPPRGATLDLLPPSLLGRGAGAKAGGFVFPAEGAATLAF